METDRDSELKLLGDKIREVRLQKGLSQEQLAHKIGKDQPSINRVENGNINPSYLYLLEFCEGLDITINQLLE